jgi:hypothetical protein
MPWLGFFHKINMADVFVILDNVQFRKNYFQNRNKIRTKEGWQWITVPVKREDLHKSIKDVRISYENPRWKKKVLQNIYFNYSKAKFFESYWKDLSSIFNENHALLVDLNVKLIRYLVEKLGIHVKIVFASSLDVAGEKSELLLNICKAVGAKVYISGISGRDYLNFDEFKKNDIEIIVQEFHHPIYKQLHEPFIPCMSVIDLLFNHGNESLSIIDGVGVPVMKELFL